MLYQILLLTFVSLWWSSHTLQSEPSDSMVLHLLTEEFWEWKLSQFPQYATAEGFHKHDDKVESYTLETFENRRNVCAEFLARAEVIPRDNLTSADVLTLGTLTDQLRTYVSGYDWVLYGYLNPLNFLEGVHLSLRWVGFMEFDTTQGFENYLSRLRQLPRQVSEIKQLMTLAIELKRVNNVVSMRDVPFQISRLVKPMLPENVFYQPFIEQRPNSTVSLADMRKFHDLGVEIIQNEVIPAYQDLLDFLNNTYIPNCRKEYGISSLDNGMDYYKAMLKWHLSTDMGPEEIHQIGLKEVERIKNEMIKIMNSVNFEGDLASFFENTKSNSAFYSHDEKGLLDLYRNTIYNKIKPRLPDFFENLDDIPDLRVRQMTYDGVTASYSSNTFWANTRRPETRPSFTALALALHEGYPGHHLQVAVARERPFPKFRRYLWGTKKFSVPFSFPYYTGYVEGWGLYAEYLGEEMGLYDDPYDLFGRYMFEMMRACRLVVDTGIHAFKWSREEAVDFMANHSFLARPELEIEVDRYITWPGQACAYKIGEIKLREIRKKAEDALGPLFDIRKFHTQVTTLGFVPLTLLEEIVDQWIEEVRVQALNAAGSNTPHQMTLIAIQSVCAFISIVSHHVSIVT